MQVLQVRGRGCRCSSRARCSAGPRNDNDLAAPPPASGRRAAGRLLRARNAATSAACSG